MAKAKLHVKKDDTVIILAGKDKGKKGRILAAFPAEGRVLVEGVNIVKRHTRPSAANQQGGIIEKEAPVHVSNVAIVDPKSGEPTRVGKKILADGTKVRYAKKSGEILDK
ncbi:50S ribosomal protein L24 [Tumebacillus sp. DT12]|uniref:Large ribosomal subunit protein uL24 n=1 Tax=Tumebacillus lacus TaxID=2995335 RepID=A0ABT3X5X7_9BACL|nr:50S ribosomal protein L24 [Tumebacillus lacus]MCX7572311.1 50S ribosomal protein L24 [Tumebacillus lacus]